jgi:tetratricopeptide (TPR) repeat protein
VVSTETGTRSAWGAASEPVVVGAIPRQPPAFLPRPALLKQLNRVDWAGSVVQVVIGPPGVGKTQLTAAYARARLAAGWRLVAWVNAEDTDSLLAGLAAVADAAGLADDGHRGDAAGAARAVRRQLEADGERCLVVLDHVDDPHVVRPFLPASGAARVLITTTQLPVVELGSAIAVDAFSDQQALALLDGRTGMGEERAAVVVGELGHLPLVLAQAAAVMGEQLVYEPYLKQLRALRVTASLAPERDQPYPRGVAEVVLLSLDAIQASDRTGVYARIMSIMAVLSAAGARRDLLLVAGREGIQVDGGQSLPSDAVDQALDRMVDRSLLTTSMDGQTVVAHRLVARVVREFLARQERLTAAYRAAALVLLARADELERLPDRPAVRDISQQVTALLDHIDRTGADADELGDKAPQAIMVGESLIGDLERVLGPDHPDTLAVQSNLAAAYRDAGRFTEAILLFDRTLAARERVLGSDDPDTLAVQSNLAAAYRDAGRFTEAIPLFERTLAARERQLGPDHPSTVNSLSDLAAAYRDAGRFTEAIRLFERTLPPQERQLGPDQPSTQAAPDNLTLAYTEAGQAAEAVGSPESVDQVGGDFQNDGP